MALPWFMASPARPAFADIAVAMSHGAGGGALFGLVFLICGIGFKVSAAPFHMWTPDVYEGAPTPSGRFLRWRAEAGGHGPTGRGS